MIDAAELAWVALVPCALVGALGILLLGPPLGHALFHQGFDELWPKGWWETAGRPEPTKHGRYLMAVLAALLPAAVVLEGSRRRLWLHPGAIRALVRAGQTLAIAFVVAFLLRQHVLYGVGQPGPPLFGVGTAAIALGLVLVAVTALRRPGAAARVAALARETRTRRLAALAVAVTFAALWLLKTLLTDHLAGDLPGFNLEFTMNDAFAVLNGLTPLVDYHIVYAKLLPYPTAVVLDVFGPTIFVYSLWMAALTLATLLAVFSVFRLVTRSSLAALALFLPFVATSDLVSIWFKAGAISPMTLTAMWPMRYGGAFLMAWLVARRVAGRRLRSAWALAFVGTLVVLNNLEFGVAAVVATVVALACARPPAAARDLLRPAASAAAGAFGAVLLVSLFTLARSGALPDPALLVEYPRIFTDLGWFSMPLPVDGFHLVIYATFVAAVALAAVRLVRREADVLLTAMIAWSGVFGLLAGGYLVGRPDAAKLYAMLGAWSFALLLLTVACVRALAASGWRRPTVPQLLVLFGFALTICSVSRLSPPQRQLARLTNPPLPPPVYEATMRSFLQERTISGEKVIVLVPMAHRITYEIGLRNVAPFPFMNAIVTRGQMRALVRTARRERVQQIFVPQPNSHLRWEGDSAKQQIELLAAEGFRPAASASGVLELQG
ncbi:MAG TPA: hypothetical protein VFU94_12540 [Conexibacter sp.]|nr:hypothetical protein [Conexibacter sp.]